MDRNVSRRRSDRAQLSLVLDAGLVAAVRARAKSQGVTLVSLVERCLEVGLDGEFGVVAGGASRSSVEGVGVRQVGGRDSESASVESAGGGVDWDALMLAGRMSRVSDPIEDIA